jgi:hypothetical protein
MLGAVLDGSISTSAADWVGKQVTGAVSSDKEVDVTKTFGSVKVEVMTFYWSDSSMGALVIVKA